MKTTEEYMQDLRKWLADTAQAPLEEMSAFFSKRIDGYEEHMSFWESSYRCFSDLLPDSCENILDLGCGTGLELDKIWQKNPRLAVTGIDLCSDMLDMLQKKHPDKRLTAICQDYFQYDFGVGKWDAVISFESLHHFLPDRKKELYQKIYRSLANDGTFLSGDYIACCEEEETLLRDTCLKKRQEAAIPDDRFVHFDIPLTLAHELELLRDAGFSIEKVTDDSEEATIIVAKKTMTPSTQRLPAAL